MTEFRQIVGHRLPPLRELPVDRAVAERAGSLRCGSSIHTTDALIAATDLEHGLTLVSRNVRDFEGIRGLGLRPVSDTRP